MNILVFDQAARVTGWSYFCDGQPKDMGIITPKPKTGKGGQRLLSLMEQFIGLIKKFNPDMVVIEDPVGGEEDKGGPGANWKTMQVLCQVQGVLLAAIESCKKPVTIISPSSWQYDCKIHRRDREGRKSGAVEFVKKEFGLNGIEQDIIDSICIGYSFLNRDKPERSAF